MVKKSIKNGRQVFLCEVCGLGYLEESMAQKCQEWCSTRHSCSLEIIKHAVTRGKV
jgi:hypothetical protein